MCPCYKSTLIVLWSWHSINILQCLSWDNVSAHSYNFASQAYSTPGTSMWTRSGSYFKVIKLHWTASRKSECQRLHTYWHRQERSLICKAVHKMPCENQGNPLSIFNNPGILPRSQKHSVQWMPLQDKDYCYWCPTLHVHETCSCMWRSVLIIFQRWTLMGRKELVDNYLPPRMSPRISYISVQASFQKTL